MNNKWNTPYLFTGLELDEETGFYYASQRYYNPREGVFLSIDPLAEKTSDPYGYGYQNPIKYTDPTGMSPQCDECKNNVKNPSNGQTYNSEGGETYTYSDGEWTRNGGMLEEVNISKDSQLLAKNDFYKNATPLNGGDYKYNTSDLKVAVSVLKGPDSPIKDVIRRILASGDPQPLSGHNHRMLYGDRLSQLMTGGEYIKMAAPLASSAFGGGSLRSNMRYNSRGHLTPRSTPLKDHPSLEGKTDLYHNFPRSFDKYLIRNGLWSQRIKDGANWYELPGSINGKSGTYQIGVNNKNVIFHRHFKPN